MDNSLQTILNELQLQPHPEGGYYNEMFRSTSTVETPSGLRNSSTAIYYLLPSNDYSGWHQVSSDEVWHHYSGQPLRLHLLDELGYRTIALGPDLVNGQRHQFTVPANTWQAAEVPTTGHALCGCTVAPGFDFNDFEMGTEAGMRLLFPNQDEVISKWIRR